MLQVFRSNQIINASLYLVYIGIIYASAFFAPTGLAKPMEGGILWGWISLWLAALPTVGIVLIGSLFLFFSAIILTLVSQNNLIDRTSNLFPGIFYSLLCLGVPAFLYPHPVLWANFFLIAALASILPTFKRPEIASNLFNAGFFVSIASLFYPVTLVFAISVLTGFSTIRSLRGNQYIIVVCGLFVPYFLLGTYLFWNDQLPLLWTEHFQDFWGLFSWQLPGMSTLVTIGIFLLAVLLVVLQAGNFMVKRRMEQQMMIQILYQFLLIGGLSILVVPQPAPAHLLVIAPFLGILIALFFSSLGKNWAGLLFSILVIGILAIHYYPIILARL